MAPQVACSNTSQRRQTVITERVKTKLAYDIKRRNRQDEQGVWMQTQYNNTVKVNLGDIVTYSVDPRDRCANINRGLIGVVAKEIELNQGQLQMIN